MWLGILLTGTLLTGCTRGDLVASIHSRDAGLSDVGDDSPPTDAGTSDGGTPPDSGTPSDSGTPPGDWSTYCDGQGPPIIVGDTVSGTQVCGGRLAEQTFRQALCTCEGLALSAPMETDAFRSASGPYQPGGQGGDVSVNGAFFANDSVTVGGTLRVGGTGGIQLARTLSVGGALQNSGPLTGSAATASIAADARVRGDVALSSITVGGILTVPPEYTLGPAQAAGVRREPVDPITPCACDAASQVDVAALITHHAGDNDNAAISLDAAALESISGERTLELPCGRFFLTSITGTGRATLTIRARTALFIQDGVDLGEGLTVDVQPPGELDLFIGGRVSVAGPLLLGSTAMPSRVRVYVTRSTVLALSAGSTLAGNLYAPGAYLSTSGDADVYGSIFVRHLEAAGPLRFHYDADVLEAGAACPP
ncbi:hypothetical protein JY651_22050 [Pyxidicoccus parkwayensis]|uniref:DUF7305 domain-containing protein n=2 Tax=Pyxidicoccus parkwayensis TaxID=2813578 RepID=A0ABX7PCM3_9BACT|nr:hypothetical protein JY651_22050 [Pyxidicoccus parkwaysis]